MNSCTSTFELACAPPLRIFIIGTGSELSPLERCFHISPLPAAARKQAIEAPSIALAPICPLLNELSRARMASSIEFWFDICIPTNAFEMMLFTLDTAWLTPFPNHGSPPSLSSTASCFPVLAPEGTIALPNIPSSVSQSTSTVGLPRESSTVLP